MTIQLKIMGRILFVVPSFSGGGAERVVTVLASNLAERGYDVHCVIYYKAEHEYDFSKKIKLYNLSKGGEQAYSSMGMKAKICTLNNLISGIKPDYIIPFLPQVGFHVWLATLGRNYKIIQTVRNDPRNDPPSKLERIIRNLMLTFSWRNFVQNVDQLNYFPKFIKKKTTILPNPVPEKLFQMNHVYNESITSIVSLGRLTKQKNFDMIIRIAQKTHELYPYMRFHIYGSGELKSDLEERIRRAELSNNVILEGRTNEPYEKMNAADIFILSSNYEGMPNALLEAMALGIPCISTNCPTGPSDIIIPNENGVIVDIDDDKAAAQALLGWINDPNELKCIGEKARQTILTKYSADVITKRFLNEVLLVDNNEE